MSSPSCWRTGKPSGKENDYRVILGRSHFYYELITNTGDGQLLFQGAWKVNSHTKDFSGVNILDSAWHRVGFTSAADNSGHLYIDGVAVKTRAPPTASTNLNEGNGNGYALVIGARDSAAGGTHPWIGDIDEVCAWGRALSTTEMSEDHDAARWSQAGARRALMVVPPSAALDVDDDEDV